jgi:hypothetical protein
VLLHQLEDAVRVLQGLVDLGEAVLAHLVLPGVLVVAALLLVVAGEDAVVELEAGVDQEAALV